MVPGEAVSVSPTRGVPEISGAPVAGLLAGGASSSVMVPLAVAVPITTSPLGVALLSVTVKVSEDSMSLSCVTGTSKVAWVLPVVMVTVPLEAV